MRNSQSVSPTDTKIRTASLCKLDWSFLEEAYAVIPLKYQVLGRITPDGRKNLVFSQASIQSSYLQRHVARSSRLFYAVELSLLLRFVYEMCARNTVHLFRPAITLSTYPPSPRDCLLQGETHSQSMTFGYFSEGRVYLNNT